MTYSIQELIKQRRLQMLVHSYLYYHLNTNIISDDRWQHLANDLTKLQAEHKEPMGFYDEDFENWDGSTGCHLSKDEWVSEKAERLLRYHEGLQGNR